MSEPQKQQIPVILLHRSIDPPPPHLQVVLVGDPQQLPATLFSQRAKEVQLERSMFERLQQVCGGGGLRETEGAEQGGGGIYNSEQLERSMFAWL